MAKAFTGRKSSAVSLRGAEILIARAPAVSCLHCGQALLHSRHENPKGEWFCCMGCLRVNELLAGKEWFRYYDLLEASGRNAPAGVSLTEEEYTEWDDEERLKSLGRWNGPVHCLDLGSPDISCAACGWLLEKALPDAGALYVRVDFMRGTLALEYDSSKTGLRMLVERAAQLGYRLRADTPGGGSPISDRSHVARLAVAGACFANVMSFSVAHYFGLFSGIDGTLVAYFAIYSFLLSLPSVTYCAWPFYRRAWSGLKHGIYHLDTTVSLGILLTFAVSVSSVVSGNVFNYFDSVTGLVFFLLIGRWAVRRFETGLAFDATWAGVMPEGRARCLRSSRLEWVPTETVEPGETIVVFPGESVPLDGLLLSAGAQLDTSLLSGEARPAALERGENVFAGYRNTGSKIEVKITTVPAKSRLRGLQTQIETLKAAKSGRPSQGDRMAAVFTAIILGLSVGAFFLHMGKGSFEAMRIAASVLIISCACAFALAVPINLGLGLKRARERGFHFRSGEILRELSRVRHVLFDKTGTLTFVRRRLRGWRWMDEFAAYDRSFQDSLLASLKAMCNATTHPVAVGLRDSLREIDADAAELEGVREILHFGMVAREKNGEQREICLSRYGAWLEKPEAFLELGYVTPDFSSVESGGFKPDSAFFVNGRLAAAIEFTEEVKPGVARLRKRLDALGLGATLLSGDHPERVRVFAQTAGFSEYKGGLSPEEKREEARSLRSLKGACLAVGDGFNDSLLFGEADWGLAVAGPADFLTDQADILFTGVDPSAIGDLLGLARRVRGGILWAYGISFTYNAAAMTLAFQGLVTPFLAAVLMPLSSLSLCVAAWLRIGR